MSRKIVLLVTIFLGFSWLNPVQAGFGVAPPKVKANQSLLPGSHFEQKIMISRSTGEAAVLESFIKADAFADWITIDRGEKFDMTEGELQVPMIVKVDVPKDAEIGDYRGEISIRLSPKGSEGKPGVAIAMGAVLDIDLNVSDKVFVEYNVRRMNMFDLYQLPTPWNYPIFFKFLYRVKVLTTIENTGNVEIAPTKMELEVFDLPEKNLLESVAVTRMNKVPANQTGDIVAYFPVNLAPGDYWGKIKVYNDDKVIDKQKIAFHVLAETKRPSGWYPWVLLGIYISAVLLILLSLFKIRIWTYIFKAVILFLWPFKWLLILSLGLLNKIKIAFFRWLHDKTSKYK